MQLIHTTPTITIAIAAVIALCSCSGDTKDYDATGTFEATEVVVSAEQNGRLLHLDIEEGDRLEAGQQVGLIDTTQLYLKARQAGTTRQAYAAQRPDRQKQAAALRRQLAKAEDDYRRYRQLVSDGAAGHKLMDDARSQVDVLRRQLDAQISTLGNSTNSLNAQMSSADAERLIIADQLRKCHIAPPIGGTVLAKYMEGGEFATIGHPLFRIADTRRMYLRAYVTSAQLSKVRIGQSATVYADYGGGQRKQYTGRVTWISAKAEFTPKTILTDDERADLVYAVKIAVKGDGGIKIGMYGEVKF